MTISRLTYREDDRVVHLPGSNFWRGRMFTQGFAPGTGEHDFQCRKTTDLRWRARILAAGTPGEAKRLGRACPMRPDWDEIRVEEMRFVLVAKAINEPDFVDWLISTGDQKIIEGNWWHDNFWGICECDSCVATGKASRAENHLGRALMQLREVIKYDYAQL